MLQRCNASRICRVRRDSFLCGRGTSAHSGYRVGECGVEGSPQAEGFREILEAALWRVFQYNRDTLVVQGGWGKISGAASTQYVVDRWNPPNVVNLGMCGGIAGRIERNQILAVTKTIVYDIVEQMGDADEAVRFYSTDIDFAWVGSRMPSPVIAAPLLSADRDLIAGDIAALVAKYGARAVDWESGAIAWTAHRNGKRVLILRGVSDMVSPEKGGEAYGSTGEFEQGTARVMQELFDALPMWLERLNGRRQ